MIFRKKLKEEELAEILHSAGLDAYNNYKDKGYSGEKWNEFRLKVARGLLKYVDVVKKRGT